jgi:hypothetical protein
VQHPLDGVIHEVVGIPFDLSLKGRRVLEHNWLPAAHGDGLQVLGPHDGTHAAAAVGVLHGVNHAGVTHQILARRPDGGHAHLGVGHFRFDEALGISGPLAPQGAGIPDLDLPVMNPEVNRLLGPSLHQDGVESRPFEFRRPPSPGLRFAVKTGQRRYGRHGIAVRSGNPAAH